MLESPEQARLHEEYKMLKLENERKQRMREGLCTVCGKPLAFTDKISRRYDHKACGSA